MRNKKAFNLIVALLFGLLLIVSGCSNTSSTDSGHSAESSEETNTETAGEENDEQATNSEYGDRDVVVTTIGTALPYSFVDENNEEWTGVDGEVWKEIENRTGWNIEVLRGGSFDASIGNLASGRADVASNHYAPTPERLEQYEVTKPYSTDIGTIAIRPDETDELKTLSDFSGKTIGVTAGSSNEMRIREAAEENNYEVATYEETDAAMQDLTNGKIDGFVGSMTLFGDYMKKTGSEYGTIEENLDEQAVVFLLGRKDDTKELQTQLNSLIDEMIADGTISAITEKYFGEDMTQYIELAIDSYEERFGDDISEGSVIE